MGQVYTGAYTEGIAVYFLTLLGLTRGAVQMCLCKETPSRKTGESGTRRRCDALGGGSAGLALLGAEQPLVLGDGSRPPLPPGGSPRSGLAVNLL